MTRHLLEIDDLSPDELRAVLSAARLDPPPPVLDGGGAALVFAKPSNRTRSSTEMAVVQLGGHPISIAAAEIGMGTRETVEDVARTLGCYHRVLCARVFEQDVLVRMVRALEGQGMDVPVVNLLSDDAHPCQALADLLTLQDELGGIDGRTLAWVGDANNVARSLALGVLALGGRIRVASPSGYRFDDTDLERLALAASTGGGALEVCDRPEQAVAGADAVSTDVWASMGQEDETLARRRAFEGWTVTGSLLELAAPDGIFLHCLPAHRGEEVSDDALEGPRSRVWQQAANRMHAIRGLFVWLLQEGGRPA